MKVRECLISFESSPSSNKKKDLKCMSMQHKKEEEIDLCGDIPIAAAITATKVAIRETMDKDKDVCLMID